MGVEAHFDNSDRNPLNPNRPPRGIVRRAYHPGDGLGHPGRRPRMSDGCESTLFGLLFLYPVPGQAAAVQRELCALHPEWDWFRWEYDPEAMVLRVTGKATFAAPLCPVDELRDLACQAWKAIQAYCEVYLILNPREAGEQAYAASEKEYDAYLQGQEEAKRGTGHETRRCEWQRLRRAGQPGTIIPAHDRRHRRDA